MKVYMETYGCASNKADSEIIAGILEKEGFEFVRDPRKADLIIINTCIVKTPTEHRMIHRIKELSALNKPMIVAGCMPKAERKLVEKLNPRASMIGPDSIREIAHVARETMKGKKVIALEDSRTPKLGLPRKRENEVIGIVPIAIGCMSECSYCITKLARGRLFSYPEDLIIAEIQNLLKEGCKEIWLTSQDCGAYGIDMNTSLPNLLEKVCEVQGKFVVRVGMMNPMFVRRWADRLAEIYENEKIFKFLHLPLQSGSDRVLKLMKRGYKVEDFLKIVKTFKKRIEEITLSTDIIVGFPGETEADFRKTLKVIQQIKPDVVNISKFGPRPYTEASKIAQLPKDVVKERSRKLHELVEQIKIERNEKWVGRSCMCIVDEVGKKGTMVARNMSYKPIVLKASKRLLGKFVEVRIEDAGKNYLRGSLIKILSG